MDNEQLKALANWSIKIQASIDTARVMLIACGVLCGAVVSLAVFVFKSFKDYTAERFQKSDEKCSECAKYNTAEHGKLHDRIDEHIRDHANKNE